MIAAARMILTLAFVCLPVHSWAGADDALRRAALEGARGELMVRIGLESEHALEISGTRGFRVLDIATGDAVWADRFDGELQVVAEGGPTGDVPSVFRIQIGAFSARDAARAELDRLKAATGATGVVRHDPDRGTYRVRMGEEADRLRLDPLMQRLREMGLESLWIAEEPASESENVQLRLVNRSYESHPTGRTRLVVVPTRGGQVSVSGTRYRGVVELRVSPFGTVRAINWVGLESYLRGVVPAELGPEVWPEVQALKAQSVAARTYIWRNRDQFAEEGFDICATPRCQVYKGAAAEHPLSDRAIRATAGEVLTYEDRPIVALYTATCGGHTEDGGLIFAEHAEAYLKGVPCRAEADAMATLRGTVRGRTAFRVSDTTGADVSRAWALLDVAGVIDGQAQRMDSEVDGPTLRGWTSALVNLAGLPAPTGEPARSDSLAASAEALLADLGWAERASVLLSESDVPALLRDDEADGLPAGQRRALAYLAWREALTPHSDGRYRVAEPARAARLVSALVHVGEAYRAFGLRDAVVAAMGANSIRLVQGKGEIRLSWAGEPVLFGLSGGRRVPVDSLEIWPGDRVRFRTDPAGRVDFLELRPPVKGASDDRSAAVYSWELRKTRRELEVSINRRVSVGRLKDLQVVRRGVSGRVVELRVVGSTGEAVVRGFDIRNLLGLRETLAVLEIQRDPSGEIDAVVFAGKGWGHGVGLCQVGAYGMALRGSDYREILGHYYRGAVLERAATP